MVTTANTGPAYELFAKVKDLPTLPPLYLLLNKEVGDPNSSMGRIAEIISADQSLTTRLLRLANSAVFGFAQKIDTITEAVSLIGLKQVRDLTLCTIVLDIICKITPGQINPQEFWKHCLGCGITARVLAAYKRVPNIERFFVSGLIHDLGRLIMLINIPEEMVVILQKAQDRREMVYVIEREMLSYDHAEVGAILMQKWGLPDLAVETTARHHRPAQATKFVDEIAIVHVADLISHAMELGDSGEKIAPPLHNESWSRLGFKPTVLASMMKDIDRQCDEVNRIMLQ